MNRILLITFLVAPLPAMAQVYKCVENGKTVYAERPCSSSAQALNIGDSAATQQRLEAEQRGRQAGMREAQKNYDDAASRRLDALERADQRRAAAAPRKPSKEERCAQLLKEAKKGKDDQILYQTSGYINDAKRRQKEAEDAHFSECYGS